MCRPSLSEYNAIKESHGVHDIMSMIQTTKKIVKSLKMIVLLYVESIGLSSKDFCWTFVFYLLSILKNMWANNFFLFWMKMLLKTIYSN